MAEENHRQYGWPIPPHLQAIVARLSPSTPSGYDAEPSSYRQHSQNQQNQQNQSGEEAKKAESSRVAAGQNALQEIDLGPEASARNLARIEEARRRMENMPAQLEVPAVRSGQQPTASSSTKHPSRRHRRNSEDLRRDALVDAVLSESKRTPFLIHPFLFRPEP